MLVDLLTVLIIIFFVTLAGARFLWGRDVCSVSEKLFEQNKSESAEAEDTGSIYDHLIEIENAQLFIFDPATQTIRASRQWWDDMGYSLSNRPCNLNQFAELISPEDRMKVRAGFLGGKPVSLEFRMASADAVEVTVKMVCSHKVSGKLAGFFERLTFSDGIQNLSGAASDQPDSGIETGSPEQEERDKGNKVESEAYLPERRKKIKKIWVIDDHPMTATFVTSVLSFKDIDSRIFLSGGEALKAYVHEAEKPDLLICDYNLQDMTGLDLVSKLSNQGQSPKAIICTGDDISYIKSLVGEIKIVDIIKKPLDIRRLEELLETDIG